MYDDEDYQKMYSMENLKRAYRWVQSNPDPYYKSYFRDSYNAYAAASQHNLKRIRRMLASGSYEPTHASKIYLPKPSGILRPYTLLTVNDQIVYQACINVIADRLKPKVRQRYEKSIFGHLYAGKSSSFFYLKWQRGYQKFSRAVFDSVEKGYDHVANFDLTSFYDSIDHSVLKYFLKDLGITDDLIFFLLKCLTKWTSCTWTNVENPIYHEHGIPQGPLSSGLLSEVVLFHIDNKGAGARNSRYFRYVDDIKIFAKNESVLRQRLISLDLAAKEIGLFPQSAKINIRKVSNPREEVKTISQPAEKSIFPVVDQAKLIKRILEISRNGIVSSSNTTRFKYLLAQASPTHKLNRRLIELLPRNPSLSARIGSYLMQYEKLPNKAAELILRYLQKEEIYHSVHADLLMATINNMPSPFKERCVEHCKRSLVNRHPKLPPPQPSYKCALLAWLIVNQKFTFDDLTGRILSEKDWWVQKTCLMYIGREQYGDASYQVLLNNVLENPLSPDAARAAAMHIVENNLSVTLDHSNIAQAARPTLFVGKKIKRIGRDPSRIHEVIAYVMNDRNLPRCNWESVLNSEHAHAERMIFTIKHSYEADINSCLVTLDSFCDLIFERIFKILEPTKPYGDYGGMLEAKIVKQNYPKVSGGFKILHELRRKSHTAHPRIKRSAEKTRRLKHSDLYKVRPSLISAFQEIASKYPFR